MVAMLDMAERKGDDPPSLPSEWGFPRPGASRGREFCAASPDFISRNADCEDGGFVIEFEMCLGKDGYPITTGLSVRRVVRSGGGEPPQPLDTAKLRELRLHRRAKLGRAIFAARLERWSDEWEEPPTRPRPTRGYSLQHYSQVWDEFLAVQDQSRATGEPARQILARRYGRPVSTVNNWVYRAKKYFESGAFEKLK